jgi:hypothetical protein
MGLTIPGLIGFEGVTNAPGRWTASPKESFPSWHESQLQIRQRALANRIIARSLSDDIATKPS